MHMQSNADDFENDESVEIEHVDEGEGRRGGIIGRGGTRRWSSPRDRSFSKKSLFRGSTKEAPLSPPKVRISSTGYHTAVNCF